MPSFTLEEIPIPHARFPIYKLVTNGTCEYDEFEKTIRAEGTYEEELDALDTLFILHAQMERLAPNKYKELSTDKSDPVKDYEFRTRSLRVYLFKLPNGKAIVIGGHNDKKQQKQDIARMRRIKKEYYANLE